MLKRRRLWIVNFSFRKLVLFAVIFVGGTLAYGGWWYLDDLWFLGGILAGSFLFGFDAVSFEGGREVTFRRHIWPLLVVRKKLVMEELRLEADWGENDEDEWFGFLHHLVPPSVAVGGKLSDHEFSCRDPDAVIAWVKASLAPDARVVSDEKRASAVLPPQA